MTAYRLSGLLSFRKTGAAFLIPCFSPGQSNEAFAQEVDDQGQIGRFVPIDVDRYACDPFTPSDIVRREGDKGVFAVRLNDGQVLTGGFDELRRRLAAVDLDRLGSPFFNIDAMAFIGDLIGRDAAVDKASQKFRTQEIAQEWRRLEARGRIAGLGRPVEVRVELERAPSLLEWLNKYFESEDWPKRWLAGWKTPEARLDLKRIGVRRVEEVGLPGDVGPVLQALLAEDPFDGHVHELTLNWLPQHYESRSWFATWDTARRKFNLVDFEPLQDHIVGIGMEALHRAAEARGLMRPADWARLWSRLFRVRGDHRHHLVGLALNVDRGFFGDTVFQQKVLTTIARRRRERVEEALTPWLLSAPVDNGWIGIYVRLDPRRLPMELKDLAVDYLAFGDVRYKGWRTLWTAMRQDPLVDAPLDEFARRWLDRASRNLIAWPEVLADMIQLHPHDRDLRGLANSWIRDNPRGGRLRLLLDVLHEPQAL